MSTHQMHQVEELCDRILLINDGGNVLYGNLDKIRRRYAGGALLVRTDGELPPVPGVTQVSSRNGDVRLTLDRDTRPQDVLERLVAQRVSIEKFEIAMPSLDEIFVQVVAADRRE
jgi:ABC-2 type transport system ATP-binding protein